MSLRTVWGLGMTPGALAPLVTVHQLPIIHTNGVTSLVEFRFREPDDFDETGWRETRFFVNAATAKVFAAQVLCVAYDIEPEDDR